MKEGIIKSVDGEKKRLKIHSTGKDYFYAFGDLDAEKRKQCYSSKGKPIFFDLSGEETVTQIEWRKIMASSPQEERPHCNKVHPIHNRPAPYTFVPVVTGNDPERRLFERVSHASSTPELVSGEIRVEMLALTPLLVGQYQYPAAEGNYDAGKKVLEPFLLNPNGDKRAMRVMIPGSSIKGMLRQSIGAMLNAPMERVGERRFSYRPNLEMPTEKKRLEPREAVVTSTNPLIIRVLPGVKDAVFVKGDKPLGITCIRKGGTVKGRHFETNKRGCRVFSYKGGLDGDGQLAMLFETDKRKGKAPRYKPTHCQALIPKDIYENQGKDITIDPSDNLILQYQQTMKELGDTAHGHLRHGHPVFSKKGREQKREQISRRFHEIAKDWKKGLEKDQLIYVEVEINDKSEVERIVSLGHNFRYRWRYADSVRCRAGQPRDELSPLEGEGVTKEGGRLSGARLLFGFVADEQNEIATGGIGTGDFSRFAGRIAINHAVEVVEKDKDKPDQRFLYLNDDGTPNQRQYRIPLKILGSPKPSAVEHYLKQDGVEALHAATRTYGDLPGFEPSGSELNGRKFYRHQPVTIRDGGLNPNNNSQPFLETDLALIKSNQSLLARYISRPGTAFRFTLRFRNLRPWELGAMLVALNPDLFTDSPNEKKNPEYAQKIGHGRPLGLGSVHCKIDAMSILQDKGGNLNLETVALKEYLEKFRGQLKQIDHQLPAWLKVMDYANRKAAGYPMKEKNGEKTIHGYHTEIRREHARERRLDQVCTGKQDFGEPVKR